MEIGEKGRKSMTIRFSLPSVILAWAGGVGLAGVVTLGGAGSADATPRASGASRTASGSEVARLEAEIKEQREILLQSMQIEQQHYDLLLRLIQSMGQGAPPATSGKATSGAPSGAASDASPHPLLMPSITAAPSAQTGEPPAGRKSPEHTAAVSGRVVISSGTVGEDVYVYVQNVHGASARGRTVEIAQRDKQFVPAVTVVQRGTRVTFPNYDAIYHNVFSAGPPHAFDLGSYRAGDAPRAVEMTSPGVVELFCNMHAKMHASVLVVPNSLWTRVSADGSFRIDNVPVGARKLVAWSPRGRAVEQTVDVGSGGAAITLNLALEADRPHNNKYGMPYGSYKE
jgi:plastocyanin